MGKLTNLLLRKAFPLAAILVSTHFALAGDLALQDASKPRLDMWSVRVTPYAWLPSIRGFVTVKGRRQDVDASFIDLLHRKIPEELFALMGAFEARKGAFSVFADLAYMKLGASANVTRMVSVDPNIGGSLSAAASGQFKMLVAEAVMAYEIAHWGQSAQRSGTVLDIYGGGRFWWQTAEVSLALNAQLVVNDLVISGNRALAMSGDITWLDPVVGLRLRHQFLRGVELMLRGDIGGFGVGSDLSWQAMGTLTWEFARSQSVVWNGMLGYRALYTDFETGAGRTLYRYDMLMHGPVVGVTASF